MSSTYSTSIPVSPSNSAIVPSLPGSMYSGHWEIVSSSVALPAGTMPTDSASPLDSIPFSSPQAASTSDATAATVGMILLI